MNSDFKYEVAISFLQDDEQLALEIADRIHDRVSVGVFVYSERQDVLIGQDGVDAFSRVFGEESRIVVILYRQGWGKSKWTRVEENAIRSRGFDEGHEFALLVKLDASNPPIWLPPTRIWLAFERYGIEGLASVIESRVQGAGGTIAEENAVDHAAKIARELSFKDEREAWLSSEKAVRVAEAEVESLISEFQRIAEGINRSVKSIQVSFAHSGDNFWALSSYGVRVGISWARTFLNSLNRSGLTIVLSKGGHIQDGFTFVEPTEVARTHYHADMDLSKRIGWREKQGDNNFFTSGQLADQWVKALLDQVREGPDPDEFTL